MCNSDTPPNNPVRGRLNAWFFQAFDNYIHGLIEEHKSKLLSDLPDHILEIGAGVGANFRYLRQGTSVTAVEPNPHMLPGLEKQAATYGITLNVLQCSAQEIPLADDSVDAVICTLVLCTVPDPAVALGEGRRILRPGGQFVFLEHVAAPIGSWRARFQTLVNRPWQYLFEGCHTNRRTEEQIRDAGFRSIEVNRYILRGPFIPVNSQISGIAVK
jgi:ubiquinone/menaquinone biosynthesis C-methylase UbiE